MKENQPLEVIGAYCIARCTDSGVHAGVVTSWDPVTKCVHLVDSRRLWRWHCTRGVSLSDIAVYGYEHDSTTGADVQIILTGVNELIFCSAHAEASIRTAPVGLVPKSG